MEAEGEAYQNIMTDGSSDNQQYPPVPSYIPETGTDAWKEYKNSVKSYDQSTTLQHSHIYNKHSVSP